VAKCAWDGGTVIGDIVEHHPNSCNKIAKLLTVIIYVIGLYAKPVDRRCHLSDSIEDCLSRPLF